MKFVLSVVLVLSVLVSHAESNDLEVARQALRDGLWEIARRHAEQAGDTPASRVIRLESLASEGKWPEVDRALKGWADAQGPAFDYYRAVVRGDHAAAARILKEGGSVEGLEQAMLYEADALARAGKSTEAQALWRGICARTNASVRAFSAAAANLMDPELLRRAYGQTVSIAGKRALALRLGVTLLKSPMTLSEGSALIRAVVKDSPDAEGAREAFLALADAALASARWGEARDLLTEAIEIWPEVSRTSAVQEGLGWALEKLGQYAKALEAFEQAEKLATADSARAKALLKQGDALTARGDVEEAMARYRRALERFPKTPAAAKIGSVIKIRELESRGRALYRTYRFKEAREIFVQVAAEDPSRLPRMRFFEALCCYGSGEDLKAEELMTKLLSETIDAQVRADAALWLAKSKFNRRQWRDAVRHFKEAADQAGKNSPVATEALLWAARSAFAESDFKLVIQLTTRIVENASDQSAAVQALLLQGEALNELARFDEAVLVFERVAATTSASAADRSRAQVLRADALFALGADDSTRYIGALEAYRGILLGGSLTPSLKLVVSFKIARVLEKLKQTDEAMDQYYTQVVLAYRRDRLNKIRLDEDARTVFSKAAIRLADEYESRGKGRQALAVLDLLATSDSPASAEAQNRIRRMTEGGGYL